MRHDPSLAPLRWTRPPRLLYGPPALVAVKDAELRISICAALVTEGVPTVIGRRPHEIKALLPLTELFVADVRLVQAITARSPTLLWNATVVAICERPDQPVPAGVSAVFHAPFDVDELVRTALTLRDGIT